MAIGIDAGEGLVEQQVLGRGHERPRDLEPPTLAARQRVGRIGRQRREIQLGQQLSRPLAPLGARQVEGLQDRQEVLARR